MANIRLEKNQLTSSHWSWGDRCCDWKGGIAVLDRAPEVVVCRLSVGSAFSSAGFKDYVVCVTFGGRRVESALNVEA